MPSHSKASCQGTTIPESGDCHAAFVQLTPDETVLLVNDLVISDNIALARIALCRDVYGLTVEQAINDLLGATVVPYFTTPVEN